MRAFFCIGGRFCIVTETYTNDSFSKYIRKEYDNYYKSNEVCHMPAIGYIKEIVESVQVEKYRELVKDWLYEDERFLYVKYQNRYIRISLKSVYFEICFQTNFECHVLFHVMEVLIRLYSHKFGIDFFHASSFKYKDSVYMLNGFGGSGKTEIMVNFLLRGANFISDDIVLINENAEIYPYTVSIPISWGAINPEFLKKINVSKRLYDICSYCKNKNGKITRRIYGKLASKYLLGCYSYKQFTDMDTEMNFYAVDNFIWLQEADFSGTFKISKENFCQYMSTCLENESRKYFDLEGFLLLKFPHIKSFHNERQALREKICEKLYIIGFAVKNRNYKKAIQNLLLEK